MSDLVSVAQQSQLSGGYRVDRWLEIELPPMFKAWRGVNSEKELGATAIDEDASTVGLNFFFSEQDAREAMGSYQGSDPYRFAQTLWRLAQVKPHPEYGFRSGIREFVVDLPTPAAIGLCRANTELGSGNLFQYYIRSQNFSAYGRSGTPKVTLFPTGRFFVFASTAHPD